MTGQAELAAAVGGGRPLVWVTPPQAAHADALWVALAGRDTRPPRAGVQSLVVAPSAGLVRQVAHAAGGYAVTGLTRATRALGRGEIERLVATPEDALALVERAALKFDALEHVVVAWPEALLTPDREPALDQLLAEAREAPRFVLAWNPSALEGFLERHARRAPIVGPLAQDPWPVQAPSRYHLMGAGGPTAEVDLVLDALSPERHVVWRLGDPAPLERVDLIIAIDLPLPSTLGALAATGSLVVMLSAAQLPYLKAVAPNTRPLAFPSAADEARSRAASLRARIAEIIEREEIDADLLVLDPLFERFDPAEVAAALVRLAREPRAAEAPEPESAVWAKIFVNAGRRDRLRPGDLVGALINEVGLSKSQIGRIELREQHCTVEVAAVAATRAVDGLNGATVRGRRLVVRLDRKG